MFKGGANNPETGLHSLAESDVPRKLTDREIAVGMGRKATDEELEEYLNRPHGKSIPLVEAISQIKNGLKKKREKSSKHGYRDQG